MGVSGKSASMTFLLAAACAWGSSMSQNRIRIDLSRVGPQVGEKAPDFALRDQTGATRTLTSILGPNGAILVFHRSADW